MASHGALAIHIYYMLPRSHVPGPVNSRSTVRHYVQANVHQDHIDGTAGSQEMAGGRMHLSWVETGMEG